MKVCWCALAARYHGAGYGGRGPLQEQGGARRDGRAAGSVPESSSGKECAAGGDARGFQYGGGHVLPSGHGHGSPGFQYDPLYGIHDGALPVCG